MASEQERILVVENDPEVSDLIARQALQPLGYRVKVVDSSSDAIQQAMLFSPHLVVANMNLPDLSGKDLLVALTSQGLRMPIIMIAEEGMESDVIQAFRLGASDYLRSPIREAELVSVVERSLKQTRARREREQLARKLRETNDELQRRVGELTTIFAIGKAVTSITDQRSLFDRIVEGAVFISDANLGWLLVQDEATKSFTLRAHRDLPKDLAQKLNQPWDDGISSLVALSGETLLIHGDPLKRFSTIARLGQAALVVPVKVRNETIGLLVVMRKERKPFNDSDQTKLEAVADYASISLANARLFRALEERAQTYQQAMEKAKRNEKSKDELVQVLSEELRQPLEAAKMHLDALINSETGEASEEQSQALSEIEDSLGRLLEVVSTMRSLNKASTPVNIAPTNLNTLVRETISRHQHITAQTGLALVAELPTEPVYAMADSNQIKQVFDGLITNAIKFSPQGGQISIRVEKAEKNMAHISVTDTSIGMREKDLAHVFDTHPLRLAESEGPEFNGMGIRLAFVKDIITAHGGQVWAENKPGEGSTFHFTLLPPD